MSHTAHSDFGKIVSQVNSYMRTPRCVELHDAWPLVGTIKKVWCNEILVGSSFRWFIVDNDPRGFLRMIQVLVGRLFCVHRRFAAAPLADESARNQENHETETKKVHSLNDSMLCYCLDHSSNNINHRQEEEWELKSGGAVGISSPAGLHDVIRGEQLAFVCAAASR